MHLSTETIILILIMLSGFYMAWNIGANDVANAMGTSVGSRALTLRQAVIIAAILEFSGAFFFGKQVSETIQTGVVDPTIFAEQPMIFVYGMLSSLLAAGSWLQLATYYGWPVSTTHTIVGAIIGFGVIIGGVGAIKWENFSFIISSWVISPLMGGLLSYFIFKLILKKIFNQHEPVAAAKRVAPYLVFCVVFVLFQVMLFNGLKNAEYSITILESILYSSLASGIGSFCSWLFLRNMQSKNAAEKRPSSYTPEMIVGIEKAAKHLERVQANASGETYFQVSNLLGELGEIHKHIKEEEISAIKSQDYTTVEKIFGYLQILSASMMAFAHGANDVANAIGPIAASVNVLSTGIIATSSTVPTWTLVLGGIGIVVGLATWGWRVIETVGKKITELTPTRGFSAEFSAALTILIATAFGLPISTTHTLVGAVIGVGIARGIEALSISTVKSILVSWIVTVPAGAGLAVFFFYIIQFAFS